MSQQANNLYEFGPFRLDTAERMLLRDGVSLPLTNKAFDTLLMLVENSGHMVEKDDLMRRVWPDTVVEESTIAQNIFKLRRTLSEDSGGQQYIETIPKHGYRFVASVRQLHNDGAALILEKHTRSRIITEEEELTDGQGEAEQSLRRHLLSASGAGVQPSRLRPIAILLVSLVLLVAVAALLYSLTGKTKQVGAGTPIRSIAVLPFKPLVADTRDESLEMGMADTLITKLAGIREITVRPIGAVRKYNTLDQDPIAAGRELGVDAILEGSIQWDGAKQVRVTGRLWRVSDGSLIWADKCENECASIFALQDSISQQVAEHLRIELSPTEQAQLAKRYTSKSEAYTCYTKAMYHFGNISPNIKTQPESVLAIDLFKKAIDLDPGYALAHAQLGNAYVRTAVFLEDNPALIERARQELDIAERLDPQLAEVHTARYFIEFSQYSGWQVETAMREARLTQQLDSNAGHLELMDLYSHIGLEKKADEQFEIALKIDPNNDQIKSTYVEEFFLSARPDEGLEASKRLFNRGPDLRYFLEKREVNEAAPLVEQEYKKDPGSIRQFEYRVLLLALEGKHREAEAAIPSILEKIQRNRGYHHGTYNLARVYALGDKSKEAVKWLRVTVKEGFPCYPLFARDPFLDTIRKDRAFIQFMAEVKTLWEGYQREFG